MAISLNATLDTAQDSMVRNPIADLLSTQIADAIPFDGSIYNFGTTDETSPVMIGHSTYRMITLFVRSTSIIQLYTNTSRTEWTEVEVATDLNGINEIASCEMSDANIGVLYTITSKKQLRTFIASYDGVIDTSVSTIFTAGATETITGISVCKRSDDTYFATYIVYDSSSENYTANFRTSSDFITWSGATSISLSGLTTTYAKYYTAVIEDQNGDILMFFDYATEVRANDEITNIYYVDSSDDGSSWSVPTKISTETSWGSGVYHPSVDIDSSDNLFLSYHNESAVLTMDTDTNLWASECNGGALASNIFFDSARRLLNVLSINTGGGNKVLCSINVINVDTWAVVRSYTTLTSPAYDGAFKTEHVWYHRHRSDGKYITASVRYGCVMVVNDLTEIISHYYFRDWSTYSWTKNVDFNFPTSGYGAVAAIWSTWIDEDTDTLFLIFNSDYVWTPGIYFVEIDLTETEDPSSGYPVTNSFFLPYSFDTGPDSTITCFYLNDLQYIPELNYLMYTSLATVSFYKGRLVICQRTDGAEIKNWDYDVNPSFPYNGINYPIYYDGHIYASFTYTASYGQSTYRGLCKINIVSGIVTYHRPGYATLDDYGLREKVLTDDGRIVIATANYGVVIYTPATDSWTRYDETTMPGFEPGGGDNSVYSVAYDANLNRVYAGCPKITGQTNEPKLKAFNETGDIKQGKYQEATYSTQWDFTSEANLTEDTNDYAVDVAYDTEEDTLWSNWTRKNPSTDELSSVWDADEAELNLTNYITGPISVTHNITDASSLSFSLSNGHLFDPHNSFSTISKFLYKGRTIELKFGEVVSGINYWQAQGTYYVDRINLTYMRGRYPVIRVRCISKIGLIEDVNIAVSEAITDDNPEEIIEDLLTTYTDFESEDISISSFDDTHTINHQAVDDKLVDVIKEILDHFNYFMVMDEDNKFETRKVKVSGSADNTYSDTTKIIDFTPDDNFSDFTNRVTVIGESLDFIEVVYAEEVLATLSGAGGWWSTRNEEKQVWFSQDRKRQARYPRLAKLKSIEEFKILWMESRGTEYISESPADELSVIITIEFPGLMEALLGIIGAIIALGVGALFCDTFRSCGAYMMAFTALSAALAYLFGQVATYEYEIYGKPVGKEKQTFKATANDTEMQEYLNGNIITQEFEDSFCYTVAECQRVADAELEIVKAQRKRVVFKKIAHLQDEIGDIINIVHPYSNQSIDIFITDLTRTFRKGTVSGSSGLFTDQISGWRL